MLVELHIHNFAIIEEISLDFKKGMTVLTGETGAGKSIIIDALGLLAGGRGSADFVRHASKKCTLEGHFTTPQAKGLKALFKKESIDLDE
ncbi:MAG: AAA family ATPase, partial [Atopostipes sp.]|nr:AAA family ATPase [Atopostipes sp.]